MILYPEKLDGFLQSHTQQHGALPNMIRVFGDDPLLIDDCLQTIRNVAKRLGIDERLRWQQDKQFDWNQLTAQDTSMSLFSSQRLLEFELPESKPGREGSDALKRYAETPNPDQSMVLYGPKLKRDQQQSKWNQALDVLGPMVVANTPERSRLPQFIQQRAKRYQVNLTMAAVGLLVEWYEGNLLALDQQLQKLALQNHSQAIDETQLRELAEDNSRFETFALQESLLQGQLEEALHRLSRLWDSDVEPALLMWIWQREWTHLRILSQAPAQDLNKLARQRGIWPQQLGLYQAWLKRLESPNINANLAAIGELLTRFELAYKRESGEDLRTLAVHLVVQFCQPNALSHMRLQEHKA